MSESDSHDTNAVNPSDEKPEKAPAKKKKGRGDYSNSMAAKRRRARTMVLQALYQWQMSGSSVSTIEAEFYTDNDMEKVDSDYFRDLFKGVVSKVSEVDDSFSDCLDRSIDKLDPIERALLRMGAYELVHRVDVPYKVVLNEAIDLAKKFGGTDGHKYVNSILDRLVTRYRQTEKLGPRK